MDGQRNLLQWIKIRPITIDDFESVLAWSKDNSFCEANEWKINRSPEELYKWWHHCVNHSVEDFIRMGITLNGKLIGYADMACIKGNTAELGIAIGESRLWGNGIGSTSAMCMMEYASKKLGISIFNAETHEANARSRKMLENIGFIEISRMGSEEYLGVKGQRIQYRLIYNGET
ncbi:GNAT family N-acetyltransferase [Paenibacillus lactis]|uniref:GNAT family N-acetyltransferase n=1 Tax=Paenibacillus lactis TaxID=228574 RepID=UPI00048B4ACA